MFFATFIQVAQIQDSSFSIHVIGVQLGPLSKDQVYFQCHNKLCLAAPKSRSNKYLLDISLDKCLRIYFLAD